MNLYDFGEELKQARLAKAISLMDISAETRINLKYLEAIERGQFQLLPQTYVRAFLREYAALLNLDPIDILQQYESVRQEVPSKESDNAAMQHVFIQDKIATKNFKDKLFFLSPLQRNLAIGIFLVAAVALVIVLANVNRQSDSDKSIMEIPFDRVIRESEAASIPQPSAVVDSIPIGISLKNDSLQLKITTLDSVWISILIDDTKAEQHLFGPDRQHVWVAKERFSITMGNAGGATFQLNGKDIRPLGKRGAVVRNSVITEANVRN